MLKKKLNGKALLAFTTAATMASMVAATPILAAAPKPGETHVSYDNRKILPDENAQYGIVIPSAIQFYDTAKTKSADLEIVGINGFDLTHWVNLDVSVTVASQNGYTLNKGDEKLDYALQYNVAAFDNKLGAAATEPQAITAHLGVGGETQKIINGTATLNTTGKSSGLYTDQLTYSFNEEANQAADTLNK